MEQRVHILNTDDLARMEKMRTWVRDHYVPEKRGAYDSLDGKLHVLGTPALVALTSLAAMGGFGGAQPRIWYSPPMLCAATFAVAAVCRLALASARDAA